MGDLNTLRLWVGPCGGRELNVNKGVRTHKGKRETIETPGISDQDSVRWSDLETVSLDEGHGVDRGP